MLLMIEEHAAGFLTCGRARRALPGAWWYGTRDPHHRRPAGLPTGERPGRFPSGKVAIATGREVGALDVDHAVAREVVTGTLVAHD